MQLPGTRKQDSHGMGICYLGLRVWVYELPKCPDLKAQNEGILFLYHAVFVPVVSNAGWGALVAYLRAWVWHF